MGLVWSDYRKVKDNTMLLTKAVISTDVRDDVWLLWKALKDTPDFEDLKADGFGLGKDQFDGNRWKVLWWYKTQKNSFDEVKGIPRWQRERDRLIQKWILKLASIKDALADENSDDNSSENSQVLSSDDDSKQNVVVRQESDDSEDVPKPKPVTKKPSAVKSKVVVKQESDESEDEPKPKTVSKPKVVVKQESDESEDEPKPATKKTSDVKPKAIAKKISAVKNSKK